MQLAILAAILTTLALAQSSSNPVRDVAWRLALVALAPLVAPLAALIGARRSALTDNRDEDDDNAISRLHVLTIGLWIGTVALILFVAQWPRIVANNWRLADWPLVDELVILTPVIGSLLLVWTAFFKIEHTAHSWPELLTYLWRHVRHYLVLILLPPLILIAIIETLASLNATMGNLDTAWWLVLPLLVTMFVLMPLAVRSIWPTKPLAAGPLRELLEAICRGRNCGVRDILIWHTGGTMANAAVVGISRRLRYVLLTDALIRRLSPLEIAAVLRHEVAHLRRHHLLWRLALLVLPAAAWMAIQQVWPASESFTVWATAALGETAATCGPPLAFLVYAVVVVGRYSSTLEHDADLEACLGDNGLWDWQRADHFARALITVCGGHRAGFFTDWLHPPLEARLAFLERAATSGETIRIFRRRIRCTSLAIAAAYVFLATTLAL